MKSGSRVSATCPSVCLIIYGDGRRCWLSLWCCTNIQFFIPVHLCSQVTDDYGVHLARFTCDPSNGLDLSHRQMSSVLLKQLSHSRIWRWQKERDRQMSSVGLTVIRELMIDGQTDIRTNGLRAAKTVEKLKNMEIKKRHKWTSLDMWRPTGVARARSSVLQRLPKTRRRRSGIFCLPASRSKRPKSDPPSPTPSRRSPTGTFQRSGPTYFKLSCRYDEWRDGDIGWYGLM